jgi:hypothetical protein
MSGEITPSFAEQFADEPSGTLKGKPAIRPHWEKALAAIADLRFELVNVLAGVHSITLYYRGHRGLAAEVFHFSSDRKVCAAFAHYADLSAIRS